MIPDIKVTNRTPEQHLAHCKKLYEQIGQSAVHAYMNTVGTVYSYCKACDAETPEILHECCVCGTQKGVLLKDFFNIRVIKAESRSCAVSALSNGDAVFNEAHELCDMVLSLDDLIAELTAIKQSE